LVVIVVKMVKLRLTSVQIYLVIFLFYVQIFVVFLILML